MYIITIRSKRVYFQNVNKAITFHNNDVIIANNFHLSIRNKLFTIELMLSPYARYSINTSKFQNRTKRQCFECITLINAFQECVAKFYYHVKTEYYTEHIMHINALS